MFKGEKTTVFWIGLIIVGYSILEFSSAIWQTIYSYFIYYPGLESITGVAGQNNNNNASLNFQRNQAVFGLIPSVIGVIIFMVIGLYIMKVGVKKEPVSNPELKQTL